MSITTYESRTLPSVFTDVHSHREVQAAKEEVQKARLRAGRMWIWILLVLGILIAVGLFAGWAYNKYTAEHERAERLAGAVTQGDTLQADYADLTTRRANLAAARQDLSQRIEVIARSNGALARELQSLAVKTWQDTDVAFAAQEHQQPTYERFQLEPAASQSWPRVQTGGVAALDREARVMNVVIAAVQRRIDVAVPGGAAGGPICNPVTGANCRRVCNPVTGENCRRN